MKYSFGENPHLFWPIMILTGVQVVAFGIGFFGIARMLYRLNYLQPTEDERKLGWSERLRRRNARSDLMMTSPDFAWERKLAQIGFSVCFMTTIASIGIMYVFGTPVAPQKP